MANPSVARLARSAATAVAAATAGLMLLSGSEPAAHTSAAPEAHGPDQADDTGPTVHGHRLFLVGATDPVGSYRQPDGLAVDRERGLVYVVDTANHRITQHSLSGEVLDVIGGRGTAPGLLLTPLAADVAPDGSIYVADSGNWRIQRFDITGRLMAHWGSKGSAADQFGGEDRGRGPVDVAVGIDGSVYVADDGNRAFKRFTSDGRFLNQWSPWASCPSVQLSVGREALLEAVLAQSAAVARATTPLTSYLYTEMVIAAAPDGTVYAGQGAIGRYSASGDCLVRFGGEGVAPGRFGAPGPDDVAVATDGDVFVADGGWQRVQRFSSEGAFKGLWYTMGPGPNSLALTGDGTLFLSHRGYVERRTVAGHFLEHWGHIKPPLPESGEPRGLAAATDGSFWVAAGNRLERYGSDAAFLGFVGAPGSAPGRMLGARGSIVVRPNGIAYVAESDNDRVQALDVNGTSATIWDRVGSGPTALDRPSGVGRIGAGSLEGSLFVPQTGSHEIAWFHTSGGYSGSDGGFGTGPAEFNGPYGIATAGEGYWVADSGNHRLVHYERFRPISAIGDPASETLSGPRDVAILPSGNVVAADTGHNQVKVFTPAGATVAVWGSRGPEPGEFVAPEAVAVTTNGQILVADTGNHRLQLFNPDGALVHHWPTVGWARDTLHDGLVDVAGAPDGSFYTTNYDKGVVQRFATDGRFEGAWILASSAERIARPYSIAVGPDNRVYLLTLGGHLTVHDPTGEEVARWLVSEAEYPHTRDFDVGPDGDLYVLVSDPPGVQRHGTDGKLVASWRLSATGLPISISVGPDGTVYTIAAGGIVERRTSTGDLVRRWSTGESNGMAVGPDGRVYISRDGAADISVYEADGTPSGHLATAGACDGRIQENWRRRLDFRPDGSLLVAWDKGCVEAYSLTAPDPIWRIERFHNEHLSESPVAIEAADTVDYQWWPRHRGASARLEKWLTTSEPARLDIDIASVGGIRLWVDGNLAFDAWQERRQTADRSFDLDPGRHRIVIHHRVSTGVAALRVTDRVSSPEEPRLPTLPPPTQAPASPTAATATWPSPVPSATKDVRVRLLLPATSKR